jgi:arginyl-tRNA synthetase
MKELLEEIGSDVARYFFVMRSMDSHLDFDLALAKKESSENPVFYLQYAHARICSIFLKAVEKGAEYKIENIDYSSLNNPEALQLLKAMIKFPEEVIDAAISCEPHSISTFLLRFAQSFHKLYTEHRFISEDKAATAAFLNLADAARIVMKNGLKLLGVSAPERM